MHVVSINPPPCFDSSLNRTAAPLVFISFTTRTQGPHRGRPVGVVKLMAQRSVDAGGRLTLAPRCAHAGCVMPRVVKLCQASSPNQRLITPRV